MEGEHGDFGVFAVGAASLARDRSNPWMSPERQADRDYREPTQRMPPRPPRPERVLTAACRQPRVQESSKEIREAVSDRTRGVRRKGELPPTGGATPPPP